MIEFDFDTIFESMSLSFLLGVCANASVVDINAQHTFQYLRTLTVEMRVGCGVTLSPFQSSNYVVLNVTPVHVVARQQATAGQRTYPRMYK